jgi:hypothetical protein
VLKLTRYPLYLCFNSSRYFPKYDNIHSQWSAEYQARGAEKKGYRNTIDDLSGLYQETGLCRSSVALDSFGKGQARKRTIDRNGPQTREQADCNALVKKIDNKIHVRTNGVRIHIPPMELGVYYANITPTGG